MNKQLKLFLELRKLKGDFSRRDIIEKLECNGTSIYNIFKEFIKDSIVIKTKVISKNKCNSKTQLFKFNKEYNKLN